MLVGIEEPQLLVDYLTRVHSTWGIVNIPPALLRGPVDLVGSIVHSEYVSVLVALREQQWMDPQFAVGLETLGSIVMHTQPFELLKELSNPYWGLGPERWLNGGSGPTVVARHLIVFIVDRGYADCLSLFQSPSPWAVEWPLLFGLLPINTVTTLIGRDHCELLRVLLQWGPSAVMDLLSCEVLVRCTEYGRHNILYMLREHAHLDGFPELCEDTRQRMLYFAVQGNHLGCVQELADPHWGFGVTTFESRPRAGAFSLFTMAIGHNNAAMIRLLAGEPFRLSRAVYHLEEEDKSLETLLTLDPTVSADVLKAFEEAR